MHREGFSGGIGRVVFKIHLVKATAGCELLP